jgi:chromosome segregation ATPase
MTKLPTAEEIKIQVAAEYGCENYEHDYEFGLGISKLMDPFEFMERVCESHTAAHTAALRSQIAQLDKDFCHCSAENSDLSSQIEGVRHDNDLLRERVKELQAKIASYESAIDGLKKVVDSLAKMKSL